MKCLDKKRMIYSFYLDDNSFEHPINKVHFKMLKRYINKFDEVVFCIIIDDKNRYDLIQKLETFIVSIYHKNITFKIYENTNYRESLVFYNEIATQMNNLDGLTFFGHNKGISDTSSFENTAMWVVSMYYFNLEHELPYDYMNGYYFYGANKSAKLTNVWWRDCFIPKNRWFYCGTFFWGKYQSIYEMCEKRGIEIPQLHNRWYDEHFPGNIVEYDEANSYKEFYIIDAVVLGENIKWYLSETYRGCESIYNDFIMFFNEIINDENIDMCNL